MGRRAVPRTLPVYSQTPVGKIGWIEQREKKKGYRTLQRHTDGVTDLAQQALGRFFFLFLLCLGLDVVAALGLLGGLVFGHVCVVFSFNPINQRHRLKSL